MNPTETSEAALTAGIGQLVRELTQSVSIGMMRELATATEGRGLVFRRGLIDLRGRVPEYEQRLIKLHLDLGVRDSVQISQGIADAFRTHLPSVAISVGASIRGHDTTSVRREIAHFTPWVEMYVSGTASRVLVAVELQKRKDWTTSPITSIQAGALPTSHARHFSELLTHGEATWLDWKADFPPGLTGGAAHPKRDEHRGKLLKSLVSIANSIVDQRGYLVYGVEDKHNRRTVVGVQSRFDDAAFQDWNVRTFSPAVTFHYREEEHDGRWVGIFDITPSSDYPHVCAVEVGGELSPGHVWFRRGTRNTLALHADLKRMFSPQDPMRTTDGDGPLVRQVKAYWEPLGWEAFWPGLNERDDKLALGFRVAYAPESRREIRLSHSNVDAHVLMLRRKG